MKYLCSVKVFSILFIKIIIDNSFVLSILNTVKKLCKKVFFYNAFYVIIKEIIGEAFMSRILKVCGLSVLSAAVCLLNVAANAATGRAAYENVRTGSFTGNATSTARMPSMPTLPLIAVGNISTDVPSNPTDGEPSHDDGNNGDENGNPPGPDLPPTVTVHECPDGGVKNSSYTVDNCMRDVLACINNGALPNGLNDMFNSDLRASIINGMGLCYNQVDKCITDVRRNCSRVYSSRADVWIDFNSRKVQPEYYSFVLRKTGLTPRQAENTCLLLDKNVYGKSFAAVGGETKVTGEYDQKIGAYNQQLNNSLVKDNPMGPYENRHGYVDSQRGYYARWDATAAECLIRVAAYNKDKQISNSWLFGTIGDDRPAEVWKAAGDSFTCNKDLFGFSLLKDTETVALIGVGGGTVLGAGIGAAAGAGVANKNAKAGEGCDNKVFRNDMLKTLQQSTNMEVLSRFLSESINKASSEMSKQVCEEILRLPDIYDDYDMLVSLCEKGNVQNLDVYSVVCEGGKVEDCLRQQITELGKIESSEIDATLSQLKPCVTTIDAAKGQYVIKGDGTCGEIMADAGFEKKQMGDCMFKNPDKQAQKSNREDVLCFSEGECVDHIKARESLNIMATVLPTIQLEMPKTESRGATIGKGAAIGAAVGAGAGGLATAITALVEHDNINCRVGDGLTQVGLNKSYSIDGLKDLYVKWKLNLPDTQVIGGGTTVKDKSSWEDACKTYVSEEACESAEFYYKNAVGALEWVYSACEYDSAGETCDPNATLLKSYDVK